MHYHVIVVEGDREPAHYVETFDDWGHAESHARAIASGGEDWLPTRYPGRPWRTGEVTAYLDRRVLDRLVVRREVSVVRCSEAGCNVPN